MMNSFSGTAGRRSGGVAVSRRALLGGMAALGAGLAAPRLALAQARTTLTWWDVYQPLIPLHEALWAEQAASRPIDVAYTGMNPADMQQALQLAFRSGQAPDVFNPPNSSPAALASLHASDWFAPLPDSFRFDAPFQQAALAEGFTTFGGRLYSFPVFSPRWSTSTPWYFAEKMGEAGVDPAAGPATWDELRQAALKLTAGGQYGILLPVQFAGRMAEHLTDLARIAGAAGPVDWRTGDYAYASDEFVAALEFLLSFQKDGSLHPASSTLDARQGRARWAAGEAAIFLDGPWNAGVLNGSFAEVIDQIEVSNIPTPDGGTGYVTKGPSPGTFWISGQSQNVEAAAETLQLLTSDAYYLGLAARMDQPPLDQSAVERAEVHRTYRKVVAGYADQVRLGPDPVMRNPAVAQVYAEMRAVTPDLGEIIQGAFSGAFDDPRPVLQEFNDRMMAERDRAIAAAAAAGAEVSQDDWVIADWTWGEDYAAGQG